MPRSVPARFALSLLVCGFVALGLAVTADDGASRARSVTVVTTSRQTLEGTFRGSSGDGVALGTGDSVETVPWSAVAGVSFDAH